MDENTLNAWRDARRAVKEMPWDMQGKISVAIDACGNLPDDMGDEEFAEACELIMEAYMATESNDNNDPSNIAFRLSQALEEGKELGDIDIYDDLLR